MMMNSEWINARAENMAKKIISLKGSPEACVTEAFERVFLKPPTQAELAVGLEFLDQPEVLEQPEVLGKTATNDNPSWRDLFVDYCHVLINSNSFLHME